MLNVNNNLWKKICSSDILNTERSPITEQVQKIVGRLKIRRSLVYTVLIHLSHIPQSAIYTAVYHATTHLRWYLGCKITVYYMELRGLFSPYVFSVIKKSPIIMHNTYYFVPMTSHTVFLIEQYVCFSLQLLEFGVGDRTSINNTDLFRT